jgi:hypothetical protein
MLGELAASLAHEIRHIGPGATFFFTLAADAAEQPQTRTL